MSNMFYSGRNRVHNCLKVSVRDEIFNLGAFTSLSKSDVIICYSI